MPIAAGRSLSLTLPASRVSESGIRAAAPTPCTARARMSIHGSVASALAAEASVKIVMPARNTVRRPKRSPRATAMSMKAAKLRVYALTTHCSSSMEAPRSLEITGSALVTTRLSSVAMNIGRDAATIASQTGIRRVVEVMDPVLS